MNPKLKEVTKKKIKELQKKHIELNGFPVSKCGYSNCSFKKKIKELKNQLKEIK